MNLKSAIIIEVTKNDNVFQFVMPIGVPLGQVYDAAFDVLNKVAELAKDSVAQAAQKPEEEPSPVVVPDAIN